MKFKSLETLAISLAIVGFVIAGLLIGWGVRELDTPVQPPRTPVLVKECVAVTVDNMTGITTEKTVPCSQPTSSGCTGAIQVTVLEDGTVKTSCPEEVNDK